MKGLLHIIAAITLLTLATPSPAQPFRLGWKAEFESAEVGGFGKSIALDGVGNVYVLGTTARREGGSLKRDLVIRKSDPQGTPIWEVRLDPTGQKIDDTACGLVVDATGGLLVSSTGPLPNTDRFVMSRVDGMTGKLVWSQTLDTGTAQATPTALALDPTGGVVQAGGVGKNGREEFLVVRWGLGGQATWSGRIKSRAKGDAQALAVAVSRSGEVAVAGYSAEEKTGQDGTVALFSAAGALQWTRYLAGSATLANDRSAAVEFDSKGDVVVGSELYVEGSANYMAVVKLAAAGGTEVWRTIISQPRGIAGKVARLSVQADGSMIAGGNLYELSANGPDLAIAKFAAGGQKTWHRLVNGEGNTTESGTGLAVDRYGNGYVIGESARRNEEAVMLVGRVNADGSAAWQFREALKPATRIVPGEVAVDSASGNVYVIGSPSGGNAGRFVVWAFYQAPIAAIDSYSTAFETAVTREATNGIRQNDIFASLATVELVAPPASGTLTLAKDGGFRYEPTKGYSGTVKFTYRLVREGLTVSTAEATITVQPKPKTGG